jgi:hypothetical protein
LASLTLPLPDPDADALQNASKLHAQLLDAQLQLQAEAKKTGKESAQMACIYCSCQLSFPAASTYIQCPECNNTMNPQAPHTNYMNCIECNQLLSHPPSSLTIQCPKCLVIMELPLRVQPGQLGLQADPLGGRARKKRKDPNAPKRASNAYMIFCKERRAQLKKEEPNLPFGKLGARLGELWRNLSAVWFRFWLASPSLCVGG